MYQALSTVICHLIDNNLIRWLPSFTDEETEAQTDLLAKVTYLLRERARIPTYVISSRSHIFNQHDTAASKEIDITFAQRKDAIFDLTNI